MLRQIDLVLRNTGWPQQAQHIEPSRLTETARISGGPWSGIPTAGHLKLLQEAVGKDLYLGADGGLVVGQAGEIDAQRVIPVPAYVMQHQRWSVQLGDDEVGGSVAIHIGGNQRRADPAASRLIKTDCVAYILKVPIAAIAPDAQLGPARRFDDCGEIDPAIVVDIDRGESPCRVGA